jgi:hypothetical protein
MTIVWQAHITVLVSDTNRKQLQLTALKFITDNACRGDNRSAVLATCQDLSGYSLRFDS